MRIWIRLPIWVKVPILSLSSKKNLIKDIPIGNLDLSLQYDVLHSDMNSSTHMRKGSNFFIIIQKIKADQGGYLYIFFVSNLITISVVNLKTFQCFCHYIPPQRSVSSESFLIYTLMSWKLLLTIELNTWCQSKRHLNV